jgi:hypothetical protein
MPQRNRAADVLLAALAVCLAALAPYLSTLDDYFVRDDFGVVQLLAAKPAAYFPRWFVTPWMDDIWGFVPDEIRPFPAVSYQLTALGGAASPWLHHAFNIALHAVNGLLVMAVARLVVRLTLPAAAFAGVVFVLLPVHAESVAWITGRVDSMPALFYVASFLAYARWRASAASRRLYIAALTLFFVALFTKQNAITMVATLAAYDALTQPRPRTLPAWLGPYVPFAAMTGGYLWLRYRLFGEMAREGAIDPSRIAGFVETANRHLAHVVGGRVDAWSTALAAALAALAVAWMLAARDAAGADAPARGRQRRASVLFFGPVWWFIGVAPTLVAGYESPRHVYLAAFGWPIVLAIAFDGLRHAVDRPAWRRTAWAAAALVLAMYSVRLHAVVGEWSTMAAVSRKAVADVRAESLAAPEGSLLILGVPIRSWEWAIPFALRPPFVEEDLTKRVSVIAPAWLSCCRGQWFGETRRTLADWTARGGDGRVIVMRWDEQTGALSRRSDVEEPALRAIVPVLLEVDTSEALDAAILRTASHLAREESLR